MYIILAQRNGLEETPQIINRFKMSKASTERVNAQQSRSIKKTVTYTDLFKGEGGTDPFMALTVASVRDYTERSAKCPPSINGPVNTGELNVSCE